jgi:tetratricopeptide (TPR) repeat protein
VFANLLATTRPQSIKPPSDFALSDEFLLKLLQSVDFVRTGTLTNAKAEYEQRMQAGAPSFEDLKSQGWIQVVREWIVIPVDYLRPFQQAHSGRAEAFEWLQKNQYTVRYLPRTQVDSDIASFIEALNTGLLSLDELRSPRPDWVAARRWEQLCSELLPDGALARWSEDWELLHWPTFIPQRIWSAYALERFHSAVFALIEAEPLAGWDEIHEQIATDIAHQQSASVELARKNLHAVPSTLVEQYIWSNTYGLERFFLARLWPLEGLTALISLLIRDIQDTENSPAPHPLWTRLYPLIARKAELLFLFGLQASARSLPIADMLLLGSSTTLTCLLLWQWSLPGDALAGNELKDSSEKLKEEAFLDAAEVLRYLVDNDEVEVTEVAALIRVIFGDGIARTGSSEESSERMRQTLVQVLSEIGRPKLISILEGAAQTGLGGPADGMFTGLLSLVDASGDVNGISGAPFVTAYVNAVATGDFRISARQMGNGQSLSLYNLARQAGAAHISSFFDPLSLASRFATVSADPNSVEALQTLDSIKRSIRVHVRVLCRIVAGLDTEVPQDLVAALVSAVRSGSSSRVDRKQADAFAAGFDADRPGKDRDRPISADLGEALTALSDEQRQQLLTTILMIEEPATLAQLLSYVPSVLHTVIRERIKVLTPGYSSNLLMLTEEQTRIEHLLNAGVTDIAALFLNRENELETLGKVPGRSLQRLRFRMRLLLQTERWEELDNLPVPDDISDSDKASAQDALEFYRGLSLLARRLPDQAVDMFQRLHVRHRDIPAYFTNLHAAKTLALVIDNNFGFLDSDRREQARELIADGRRQVNSHRNLSETDRAPLLLNSALLSLAIRRPKQALDLLSAVRSEQPSETLYAYRALALHRLGNPGAALGTLQEAENRLGKTQLVEAVANQINTGIPFFGPISSSTDEDPVRWIRRANEKLLALNAVDQARALSPGDATLGDFLLRHLREASAGVTQLRPMMRNLGLDSSEDDVTAVLQGILNARLRLVSWALGDQSKGGWTAEENPGERDLVVKRDTAILSVIEAIMVRNPTTHQAVQNDLTLHFKKLFAYESCKVYFHISYVMIPNPGRVLEHLSNAARSTAPAGIKFLKIEPLVTEDSGPMGFSAVYTSEIGERRVHFLVLDLHQGVQKNAAKEAQSLRPKPAKKASKKNGKQNKKAAAKKLSVRISPKPSGDPPNN